MKEIDKVLSDNGLKPQEWSNSHKEEDSVAERLKLAEKLKSIGVVQMDKRIHKKSK